MIFQTLYLWYDWVIVGGQRGERPSLNLANTNQHWYLIQSLPINLSSTGPHYTFPVKDFKHLNWCACMQSGIIALSIIAPQAVEGSLRCGQRALGDPAHLILHFTFCSGPQKTSRERE